MDPTSSVKTRAKIFNNGEVYIGAKDLMDESKKFKVFGAVIHELCHAAMLLIYWNNFEPYSFGETQDKADYQQVVAKCLELEEEDQFVYNAFGYSSNLQHSELIVTYPQMLIDYTQEDEEIKKKNTKKILGNWSITVKT